MISLMQEARRRIAHPDLLLLVFALLGLSSATVSSATIPQDLRERHVINRLSFGPRPGDIERVKAMGVDRYIEEQLSPKSIPLPQSLTAKLDSLETLPLNSSQLFLDYGPPSYARKQGDKAAAHPRARAI